MTTMKCICDIVRGNIREARMYIERAMDAKTTDKPTADWMRSMAASHLDFNKLGMELAKKHMEEIRARTERQEYNAGMLAVWEEVCGTLTDEQNEVKMMVESYK